MCRPFSHAWKCAILGAESIFAALRRTEKNAIKEENAMEASKVYYTDFRCPIEVSLPEKLRRLCIAAGIKDIDMDGKFVAIKMHFR